MGRKEKTTKKKKKCPMCWRTGHEVQDCWLNSKGKGKGQGKKGGNNVNQVADDNASVLSAGPSASQAGSTASATKPGVRRISDERTRVLRIGGGDNRQGHLYRKGVGILLYLAPERPDLMFALKKLSMKLARAIWSYSDSLGSI